MPRVISFVNGLSRAYRAAESNELFAPICIMSSSISTGYTSATERHIRLNRAWHSQNSSCGEGSSSLLMNPAGLVQADTGENTSKRAGVTERKFRSASSRTLHAAPNAAAAAARSSP